MIREYKKSDLIPTSGVWLRSGQAEYHYLVEFQKLNASTAEVIFSRVIQSECTIWVYEESESVVGFMAMKCNYIDRLYIDPPSQGKGIGSKFIAFAKELYPQGLYLKTHVQNYRACSFYEGVGFKVVGYGVSPPPESMPDVEYHWMSGKCT